MDLVWGIYGIPTPEKEYRFHATRRWRFDYAWPNRTPKVAVEIEGGIWNAGRHIRPRGYAGDMEKYNEAQKLGWRVYRFTPQELRKGKAQAFLQEILSHG